MREDELTKIVKDDVESMRKGVFEPDAAYRLYIVFRTLYRFDEQGKTTKTIRNFYNQLKKEHPKMYRILVGEDD